MRADTDLTSGYESRNPGYSRNQGHSAIVIIDTWQNPAANSTMAAREPHLLLVDDDPTAILAMRSLLAEYPNQRFAVTGEAALSLAREFTPDLILLDVDLPGMSGLEVCDALRADPRLQSVPIIMATAHDRAEFEVRALKRGATDFVSKPLQPEQFRARVRAHLNVYRSVGRAGREWPAVANPEVLNVPRLLIVDDDVAAIHALRSSLEHMGHFHFATTSGAALQLVRSVAPDLILLDAQMPGMDGYELCQTLKADPAHRHIPVVFVTRYSDAKREARALEIGAADFVSKPYISAVLQARVRNLLELKRRYDADLRSIGEHWRQLGDARVADIVRAASDAILSGGADGRVVLANASAGRLFGVSQESLIGQPLAELVPSLGAELDAARPEPVRVVLRRGDGRSVAAEVSVSRTGMGVVPLTTLVLRDVTDRERTEAHERARVAAEAANLTKTRMLSHIAHEMGNPLNGVLGFIQLAQNDVSCPLTKQQARWMDLALSSARSLERLMRDLLDMGRRDSAEFAVEFVAVDAAACVRRAAEALEMQARETQVELRTPQPDRAILALADAQRLHQCLVNLISNALKYNRPGGWVEVTVVAESDKAVISVRDNGIGLGEAQMAHLFEPYNRLGQGESGTASGTGLGLVITRQLIEAMNGAVRVASSPGAGSCFTIVLPLTPVIEGAGPASLFGTNCQHP